ncbi:hypothetical protein TRIATDRAFT_273384 [Trichoderma atroviride IMI 206040]|uniref:Uncharacterized protein n=1 Tax=Hypocrea atroviridis (strain ATCC 20476 / IMI 206040) TaxID=452589 RepID=G9NSY3_HYPAI|nr:uncharacterized protein TRIATDRAFT_273384 [Trichoderma atroviride IMI 206040]EHK46527.1 hypothetical protein TRIATDRAFT_273384 [Trichoderma atroviride IMI 206040]
MANDNSKTYNEASSTTVQRCTEANIALVPEDLDFCIRQTLLNKGQIISAGMRQAPGEAEAEAEANMSILLHAFDAKFSTSFISHGSKHRKHGINQHNFASEAPFPS